MTTSSLSPNDRRVLLNVARTSINHGLIYHRPYEPDVADFSVPLNEPRASFVTLKLHGELRGCIGRLEADQPLVRSVAYNAYAAAFRDPRFPPLTEPESRHVTVHISVLSPMEPIQFKDESDLLRQIRPGVDGLVLEAGQCRGTFLPAVWETIPDPKSFLEHLKVKSGLHPEADITGAKVMRYTCESIEQGDIEKAVS